MKAGTLRHTVDIRTLGSSTGGGSRGQTTAEWETAETTQAAIVTLGGAELTAARELVPAATHMVTMRYTANVTRQARIRFGARVFKIEHVDNREERNREMQLTCSEVQD